MAVKAQPDGYHAVTPYLVVDGAARLIDFIAEDGIVGAYKGSSAREVLYTAEQWEQVKATNQLLPRAG